MTRMGGDLSVESRNPRSNRSLRLTLVCENRIIASESITFREQSRIYALELAAVLFVLGLPRRIPQEIANALLNVWWLPINDPNIGRDANNLTDVEETTADNLTISARMMVQGVELLRKGEDPRQGLFV